MGYEAKLWNVLICGLLAVQFFGYVSSANFPRTTLSEPEEMQQWIDEFEHLQTATRSKVLEEYLRKIEEEQERTRNTPEIDIYNASAESTTYWWQVIDNAPDYPDEPHIKAGMFTGTTADWPKMKTNGTTISTTFRFTKFKHKIPNRLIGKRIRRREEP